MSDRDIFCHCILFFLIVYNLIDYILRENPRDARIDSNYIIPWIIYN